jgi:hypothetical protein
VSDQQHTLAAIYALKKLGTHFTGGWVGLRAGLDGRKNLVPIGIRFWIVQPVGSNYTD